MVRLLNRRETAEVIEGLDCVRNAGSEAEKTEWRRFAHRFDFVVLGAGEVVRLEKPVIKTGKDLPGFLGGPRASEAEMRTAFITRNLKSFPDLGFRRWLDEDPASRQPAHPSVVFRDKANAEASFAFSRPDAQDCPQAKRSPRARLLSDDEIESLVRIDAIRRERFAKRLASYARRYPGKIR